VKKNAFSKLTTHLIKRKMVASSLGS